MKIDEDTKKISEVKRTKLNEHYFAEGVTLFQ